MSRTCVATVRHDRKIVRCELERGHSARGFNHFTISNGFRITWWRGKLLTELVVLGAGKLTKALKASPSPDIYEMSFE